jgi:hypothetical protein
MEEQEYLIDSSDDPRIICRIIISLALTGAHPKAPIDQFLLCLARGSSLELCHEFGEKQMVPGALVAGGALAPLLLF